MGDLSNEPSMEDILSSIKQIIAEDSNAALSAPRARRTVARVTAAKPDDDGDTGEGDAAEILELTESAPPDTAIRDAAIEAPASAATPAAAKTAPANSPPPAKPPLVSDATLSASRTSIAALSALVVKPEIHGGDTLEGLVREMLKPMLAEWLDQRLPDVVERLVAQEIARITSRS